MQKQQLESDANALAKLSLLHKHREMINLIMGLPEFPAIMLWNDEQKVYLNNKKIFWRWCGLRIDYLQMVQCGFSPKDPKNLVTDQQLQEHLKLYTDYIFAILQVVIDGFSIIKQAALRAELNFCFNNPRELFVEICKGFSSERVNAVINRGISTDPTLKDYRHQQKVMGKLYRDTLPQNEREAVLKEMECCIKHSAWSIFWLYAILKKY